MNKRLDLRHRSLWPFIVTYLVALIFFPSFRVYFASPLIVTALYQMKWNRFLWFGLWIGIFLDLLSSDYPIGFHGASFVVTCVGLSSLKHHFFSDSISTLPIMTAFASLFQSLTTAMLAPFFDLSSRFSIAWIFSDLICMPIVDGVISFLYFTIPLLLFQSRSRRTQDYFVGGE